MNKQAIAFHRCKKFTYEYVEIYKDKEMKWWIDIDSQASAEIFCCPFCAKILLAITEGDSDG